MIKKNIFKHIQIIQWQVTTRLVGSHNIQDSWSNQELRPQFYKRDAGFRNFEDSHAVYQSLLKEADQHTELYECDAITRLLTLYDVMSAAAIHADKDAETLKVFLAPDGYFCDALLGYYSLSQTRLIKHLLQSVIGCQERFSNWLIIPGTIKWKNCDGELASVDRSFYTMKPLNTSAVVLYKGDSPLVMSDNKVLNQACFFIEPVTDKPDLLSSNPIFANANLYLSQDQKRLQDLQRHVFKVGDLDIGLEINEEQEKAAQGENCLSEALKSLKLDKESLSLQILLSSNQILVQDSLNIKAGGLASSINGLVGVVGEAEPVSYQLFQKMRSKAPIMTSDEFLRKNFLLPKPLQLTGEPKTSVCYNNLGQEQVLVFNYDFGMLRLFKSLDITGV